MIQNIWEAKSLKKRKKHNNSYERRSGIRWTWYLTFMFNFHVTEQFVGFWVFFSRGYNGSLFNFLHNCTLYCRNYFFC